MGTIKIWQTMKTVFRGSRKLGLRALSLVVPAGLIGIWQMATVGGFWPSALVASPQATLAALVRLLSDGTLLTHAVVSLGRLSLGFGIGVGLAVVSGLMVGIWRKPDAMLTPTFSFLAPVPVIAWIPVFILMFGIEGSRIALIAAGVFFALVFNIAHSIRTVDQRFVEVALILEKTSSEQIAHVFLPSAAIELLAALRGALSLSWILLLAGEVIASSSGLGWLIWNSRSFARPDEMAVGMIAIGCLGYCTDSAVRWLQHKLSPWRKSFAGLH